jgi:TRAP-type transport system periplasmic protein
MARSTDARRFEHWAEHPTMRKPKKTSSRKTARRATKTKAAAPKARRVAKSRVAKPRAAKSRVAKSRVAKSRVAKSRAPRKAPAAPKAILRRPIEIRLGGYGPASTGFSKGLKLIGDRVEAAFGDDVKVQYVYNIMDLGYKAEDILWLVESGVLSAGYQSSSYLTDRVPELGLVDLPFLFSRNAEARAAIDGALGQWLVRKIEAECNYRILGWFENGFRHISNRVRAVRNAADLADLSIRVLPSEVQRKTFELLGARPMRMDLTEAIAMIKAGTLDAQENPLANTVTYGVHKFHRFHTLTNHFYISRPIFFSRAQFDAWPRALQKLMREAVREAVAGQRISAEQEHEDSRKAILAAGCEIVEPTADEQATFVKAVKPMLDEANGIYGRAAMKLAGHE